MRRILRNSIVLAFVAIFVAWVWLLGAGASGAKTSRTKPAAARPGYKSPTCIAFSPEGRLAYVTNHTAGTLSVIDTQRARVATEIPVGQAWGAQRRAVAARVLESGVWRRAHGRASGCSHYVSNRCSVASW